MTPIRRAYLPTATAVARRSQQLPSDPMIPAVPLVRCSEPKRDRQLADADTTIAESCRLQDLAVTHMEQGRLGQAEWCAGKRST